MVRVLSEEAGGGPYLVNRPNMNGATVTRKLTLHVTTKGIPRELGGGRVRLLSLASLITNARFENRFRDEVGKLISRVGRGNGVVLFVSRIRDLINANSGRNAVGTTGVLGPTLSENRIRIVNTAAFGRCEGCVRGSSTLREEFRPMGINRPAVTRSVSIVTNMGNCCRTRRHMVISSSVIHGAIILSRECVASHFLPSGTVSLLSRDYTYTTLHGGDVRHRSGLRSRERGLLVEGSTLAGTSRMGCRRLTRIGADLTEVSDSLGRVSPRALISGIARRSVTGMVRL